MTAIIASSALLLLLIWVSVHDIRTHKIENVVHVIVIIAAFFVNDLPLGQRIFGLVFCFIPFLICNIISGNKIGMGDVKLVSAFGFVLGVYGGFASAVISLTAMVLSVGSWQKLKKQDLQDLQKLKDKAVPLAPFLCGGFVLILLLSFWKGNF